jgi:2'-5' RNA ligase
MRLFLGIFPPDEVRDGLARLAGSLRSDPGLGSGRGAPRWVAPERLHVTLAFLGDQPPEVVPDLLGKGEASLGQLAPFDVELAGLGGFPNERRARVLWLGVRRGHAEVMALAERLFGVLRDLDLRVDEEGRFHPHVTLARAGGRPMRVPALDTGAGLGFRVHGVALVQSHLEPQRVTYEVLGTIPLRGGETA